jgi:hypothetical protein
VKGMPLSSEKSHWNTGPFLDEIMMLFPNSDNLGCIKLSIFTIALLKDTGYYADVNSNFVYPIYWGQRKSELLPNYPIRNKKFDMYKKADSLDCTLSGEIFEKDYFEFKNNVNYLTQPISCSRYFHYHNDRE